MEDRDQLIVYCWLWYTAAGGGSAGGLV